MISLNFKSSGMELMMYNPSKFILKIIVIQSLEGEGRILHIMSHNVEGRTSRVHNHVTALTAGTWRICYLIRIIENNKNILIHS